MSTLHHALRSTARYIGGRLPGSGSTAPRLRRLALALGLTLCPWRLPADVIEQHFTINPADPGWTEALNVARYDQGAGPALLHVDFVLRGTITGSVGLENVDPAQAQSLSVSYSTTLTLSRPDASTLAQVFPTYEHTQELALYDNSLDYAGTSGVTLAASATSSVTTSTSAPADLALFTGTGDIALSLTALDEVLTVTGQSGKQAPSSALSTARGSAELWVYYHTPEPAAGALLGLALASLLSSRPSRSRARRASR